MKNRNLRYGVVIGGVISLAMYVSYLAAGDPPDFGMMETVGYTSMILGLLGIVLGIRSQKEKQGGRITMGEATKTGMIIAAVAGLIVGIYTFAHIAWIDPGYGEKYMAYEEQSMIADGASQTEIEQVREDYESMRAFLESPVLQGLVMGATIFGFGALVTIIAALILRRRDPDSGALQEA